MKPITPQNIGTVKPIIVHCITRLFICNQCSLPQGFRYRQGPPDSGLTRAYRSQRTAASWQALQHAPVPLLAAFRPMQPRTAAIDPKLTVAADCFPAAELQNVVRFAIRSAWILAQDTNCPLSRRPRFPRVFHGNGAQPHTDDCDS
jgi:hypothetical protein